VLVRDHVLERRALPDVPQPQRLKVLEQRAEQRWVIVVGGGGGGGGWVGGVGEEPTEGGTSAATRRGTRTRHDGMLGGGRAGWGPRPG